LRKKKKKKKQVPLSKGQILIELGGKSHTMKEMLQKTKSEQKLNKEIQICLSQSTLGIIEPIRTETQLNHYH